MSEPIRLENQFFNDLNNGKVDQAVKVLGLWQASQTHALEEVADGIAKMSTNIEKTHDLQEIEIESLKEIVGTLNKMYAETHKRVEKLEADSQDFKKFMIKIDKDRHALKVVQGVAGFVFVLCSAWVGTVIKEVATTPAKINLIIERLDKLEKLDNK